MRKEERIVSDRVEEFEVIEKKDNKKGYTNYESLLQKKKKYIWPEKESNPTAREVLVVKGMEWVEG